MCGKSGLARGMPTRRPAGVKGLLSQVNWAGLVVNSVLGGQRFLLTGALPGHPFSLRLGSDLPLKLNLSATACRYKTRNTNSCASSGSEAPC